MSRAFNFLVAAVLGCIIPLARAATPDSPERYVVNLSPASKVGDRYHILSKTTEKSDVSTFRAHGVKSTRHIDDVVELDGVVQVAKIDSRGNETSLECTVNHLQVTREGGSPLDVVPQGAVISTTTSPLPPGERFQRFVTLRPGRQITPEQFRLINRVLTARAPEAPTIQDIFGSGTAQLVGGSWAINRERGCKYYAELQMQIEPRDFVGKSQFVGIEKLGSRDFFRIDATAKAAKYVSTFTSNVKTDKAMFSMKFSQWVPKAGGHFGKTVSETHEEFRGNGVDANVQGFRSEGVSDLLSEITIEPVK